MAAESLWHSDSYWGARYRRLRGRREGKKAVQARAHYRARPVYRRMTQAEAYVDRGAAYFDRKRSEREIVGLKRKAAALGLKLVPMKLMPAS